MRVMFLSGGQAPAEFTGVGPPGRDIGYDFTPIKQSSASRTKPLNLSAHVTVTVLQDTLGNEGEKDRDISTELWEIMKIDVEGEKEREAK